jgi:hypothetical protein
MVTEGEGGAPERVELDRGVTLELRIVSASGQRPPQVTLVTEEQRAELQTSGYSAYAGREIHSAQRAQPGPDGKAVLKALAPGRYFFQQAPKGSVFEPSSFEIPAVDVHSVEVRWWIDQGAAAEKEKGALNGMGYAGF